MTALHLQPIEKPQGIRDRVKRALRAAIISGEMAPGQVYSAPTLGDSLGVSPTPVREAMLELVKEGLVERIMNRGFRVTEVDEAYMDEIAQLRELIEPPMVRDVVNKIPDGDLPALRALAESIVTHAADHKLVAYLDADTTFHLSLLRYGGNDRIVGLIEDLRGQARLVGLAALAGTGELAVSAQEHVHIIDAIEARDAERVHLLMIGHIRGTRGRLAQEHQVSRARRAP